MLLHADGALVASDEAEDVVRNYVGKNFVAKKGSIGLPTRCLGRSARKVLLDNVADAWGFSSSHHVRAAADDTESHLKKKVPSFPKSCDSPLPTSHRTELDVAPELSAEDASHFQPLVGVLRWTIEVARFDAYIEASMMASCTNLPHEGHLEMICRIFSHLKKNHSAEIVFDPSKTSINNNDFERKD